MKRTVAPAPPITVDDAAELIGCSRRTIIYQINHGHLKAQRFGTAKTAPWMVDAEDAARLRDERAKEAESDVG